jgi:hypothetical protein
MNLSIKIILIFLSTLISQQVHAQLSLKAFETDGCTLFIDGPPHSPGLWNHCCEEHDMRYWFGGSVKDMNKADLRLKACVAEVAGQSWAQVIYAGVKLGHLSPIKNKTHWGWGWYVKRLNLPLNEIETNYVIEELHRLPYDETIIDKFIELNF